MSDYIPDYSFGLSSGLSPLKVLEEANGHVAKAVRNAYRAGEAAGKASMKGEWQRGYDYGIDQVRVYDYGIDRGRGQDGRVALLTAEIAKLEARIRDLNVANSNQVKWIQAMKAAATTPPPFDRA